SRSDHCQLHSCPTRRSSDLIAKGLLNSPFEHCHFVTTTTHKTLRGPRGGMILMGRDFENPFGLKTPKGETRMMSSVIDLAVFPRSEEHTSELQPRENLVYRL